MRRLPSVLVILAMGCGLLAAASLARAQTKPGDDAIFEIVKAEYGTPGDHAAIDVTTQLAAKIADGKLQLQIAPELFGNPMPKKPRAVRVTVKYNDATLHFMARDGQLLDINKNGLDAAQAFAANPPPCQIVHAEYGADDIWMDVTKDVSSIFADGISDFQVCNAFLGTPAIAYDKKLLKITVSYQGQTVLIPVYEWCNVSFTKKSLDAALSGIPPQKDIEIIKAEYGGGDWTSDYDVTDDVRALVAAGVSKIEPGMALFGQPCEGPSSLRVSLNYQGHPLFLAAAAHNNEGLGIDLSAKSLDAAVADDAAFAEKYGTPDGCEILKAEYWGGASPCDVTAKMQQYVKAGNYKIPVRECASLFGVSNANIGDGLRISLRWKKRNLIILGGKFFQLDDAFIEQHCAIPDSDDGGNLTLLAFMNRQPFDLKIPEIEATSGLSKLAVDTAEYGAFQTWDDAKAKLDESLNSGPEINFSNADFKGMREPADEIENALKIHFRAGDSP